MAPPPIAAPHRRSFPFLPRRRVEAAICRIYIKECHMDESHIAEGKRYWTRHLIEAQDGLVTSIGTLDYFMYDSAIRQARRELRRLEKEGKR